MQRYLSAWIMLKYLQKALKTRKVILSQGDSLQRDKSDWESFLIILKNLLTSKCSLGSETNKQTKKNCYGNFNVTKDIDSDHMASVYFSGGGTIGNYPNRLH